MQLHTSEVSDEFSELPTTPQHDQTLVNQSDYFPPAPQAMTSFQQVIHRKFLTLNPVNNPEEEDEIH